MDNGGPLTGRHRFIVHARQSQMVLVRKFFLALMVLSDNISISCSSVYGACAVNRSAREKEKQSRCLITGVPNPRYGGVA